MPLLAKSQPKVWYAHFYEISPVCKKSYRTVASTTSPLLKLSDKFCRYAFSQTTHFDYGEQRYVQIILPHSYMIVIAVILALIAK